MLPAKRSINKATVTRAEFQSKEEAESPYMLVIITTQIATKEQSARLVENEMSESPTIQSNSYIACFFLGSMQWRKYWWH